MRFQKALFIGIFVATLMLACGARNGAVRPRQVHPTASDRCDSDADGAMWGLFLGTAPGALVLGLSDSEGNSLRGLSLFLVGSIGGFWTGLAIDSAHCEVKE